jgi:membrane protease YdiL (CAAX protease family)
MSELISRSLKNIFAVRWNPTRDLAAVGVSWLLVVGTLYTATVIVTAEEFGGLAYFFLYAVLAATVFGIGIPLVWTVAVRHRPLADLGITSHELGWSIVLQVVFAALLFGTRLTNLVLPPFEQLLPLVAMALAIGFFEVVFWRGWVQLRLEEAFGIIPASLLAALLYAVYHIGYAMPISEIGFLFVIGIMFATIFRLTKSIFILYPLFQPMGQLVTLINDGLTLPFLAWLGFVEVLIVMLVLVWFAGRYYRKHQPRPQEPKYPTPGRPEQPTPSPVRS